MQSAALGIVTMLLWGSVISSLVCFLTDRQMHALLKAHWKPMLVCLALVLLWRIPADGEFFHGTEYEDSYIYTVAGRQMAEHRSIKPDGAVLPYSITVCAVGSLTSCKQSANYPEHLIGFPYVLSVVSKVFGYRSSIGSMVNVASACLVDALTFLLCMELSSDAIVAASAALIFAITPAFAVWGLETSAEPFSCGCITLALWWCVRFAFAQRDHGHGWHHFIRWCAFTTILLFSLTVKRENILLVFALPVIVFLVHNTDSRPYDTSIRRSWWVVLSAALGLILSFHMRTFQTMSSETALLNAFPLTGSEVIRLLATFVQSFFIVQWYGGAALLVLIGGVAAWRHKGFLLLPLVLFVAFVLLYAFHIRSYYEMRSGSTDPRAALRFSMNLMSQWSMLAGLGVASLFGWLRRTRVWRSRTVVRTWALGCAVVIIAAISYSTTMDLRDDVVEDEFRMRIEPSITAAQIAAQDKTREEYILTLEPLIPQMYAIPSVDVFSFDELNATVMNEIGMDKGLAGVLYVDEQIHRTSADAERYNSQLAYLNQLPHKTLVSNAVFSVVRLR